jgi:hypothetical protein
MTLRELVSTQAMTEDQLAERLDFENRLKYESFKICSLCGRTEEPGKEEEEFIPFQPEGDGGGGEEEPLWICSFCRQTFLNLL